MNSKMIKATIAMLKIQERALAKGLLVSIPTVEGTRYDCIIDCGNQLQRVQVKYAGTSNIATSRGAVHVSLTKARGRGMMTPYTTSEIDLILVYVAPVDKICAFGPSDFHMKQNLNIRFMRAKNGQTQRCVAVDDRLW